MREHKEQYMKEINTDPEYRTTLKEFTQWLEENNMVDIFNKMLQNEENDDYYIAVDFSIPVTMVKYFRKK